MADNVSDDITIHRFTTLEPHTTTDSNVPHPRSGHRIVADDGNFYSIGGYNPDFWGIQNTESTYYPLFKELWQYNLATRSWIQLSTRGAMPVELASHSAVLFDQKLVVFGGTGVPFGDSATNNLSVCDLRSTEWQRVKCTGTFPNSVYGQSMFIHRRQLYIFGGTTGWEYNADLYKLDIKTREWSLVSVRGECPEGRYRHEVACFDDKMYVFGGGRSYRCYDLQQIPVLDLDTYMWDTVHTISDPQHGFPAERRCHSCVKLNEAVYICGGYDGEDIFGDVWRLCFLTKRWRKLSSTMPEPAYFHSAAVTPAGCMIVYGGVTEIDLVRTSKIYSIWLEPPSSLRELAWNKVTKCITNLDEIPRHKLLELGIPNQFVSRIQPLCESDSWVSQPSVCG